MALPSFQMPESIELDESTYTNTYGKFIVQPLERGFGVTIGNAFRRVLLSSIPGAAITTFRVDGVLHEFSSVPGVLEDVIVQCPACGEDLAIQVDTTAGDEQEYVEDCPVCCRPMDVYARCRDNEVESVSVSRD